MKLLIVESPAKTKKIETFLGKGYKCIASFGHIRELDCKKNGLKCLNKELGFEPTFINVERQKENIKKMKLEVAKADEVYLATDDDREGEGIAWHICMVCDLNIKTTKRIIFHEITKDAITKAVKNPTKLDLNKINAQKTRQILDLLVGYSVTPILWNNFSSNKSKSLSAGRCQTPALRLVYDNQIDIEKNKGTEGYEITGYFTKKKIQYKLSTQFEMKDEVTKFLENTKNFTHKMKNLKEKIFYKETPKPFTTSLLQQKASNMLGYSPKNTMLICQNLYEAGYITYMRTDSLVYSKEFLNDIELLIKEKYGIEYIKDDLMKLSGRVADGKSKNKKNIQEAHEAIRPTKIKVKEIEIDNKKITNKEIRMYKLIWENTMESCMSKSKYNKYCSTIICPIEKIKYKKICENQIFNGWEIIKNRDISNDKEIYEYLKRYDGDEIEYNNIIATYSIRNLKTHYTEAKLVNILEKYGIGRPSTYSSIVSKIQERDYVRIENIDGKKIECVDLELKNDDITEIKREKKIGGEKKKIIIQPIGRLIIEFLIKNYNDLFNYDYTKNMECLLDDVSKGSMEWIKICNECNNLLEELNKDMMIEKKNEYKIDNEHKYIVGRYGPVIAKINKNSKSKKDMYTFLKIKPNLTLEEIKEKKLKIKEIIYDSTNDYDIEYNGEKIKILSGKYGKYFKYKNKSYSIKDIEIDDENPISIDIIKKIIDEKKTSIVREINKYTTLRKGKNGLYIFYKTSRMKSPKFINIRNYTGEDIETDTKKSIIEWLKEYI